MNEESQSMQMYATRATLATLPCHPHLYVHASCAVSQVPVPDAFLIPGVAGEHEGRSAIPGAASVERLLSRMLQR